MRKLFEKLAGSIDTRDMVAFGGLALVWYGLHAIYPPAAWIVVGTVLLWIGVR